MSANPHYQRWYEQLHHGAEPYTRTVREPPKHSAEFELGRLESVTYQMPVGERRPIRYKHDFGEAAMPLLLSTERGKLIIREGRYTVTQHGITDEEKTSMSNVTQYYSAHPRYREEPEQNPIIRRPGGGFQIVRAAPSGVDLVKVGATAGVASLAGGYAVAKWLPRMSLGWRGLLQGGVGVASGYALRKVAPNAAAGLAAYGFVAATQGVTAEIRINQMVTRAITPQTQQQTTQQQQTTTTAGAAVGQGAAPAQGLPLGVGPYAPPGYARYNDFRRVA